MAFKAQAPDIQVGQQTLQSCPQSLGIQFNNKVLCLFFRLQHKAGIREQPGIASGRNKQDTGALLDTMVSSSITAQVLPVLWFRNEDGIKFSSPQCCLQSADSSGCHGLHADHEHRLKIVGGIRLECKHCF